MRPAEFFQIEIGDQFVDAEEREVWTKIDDDHAVREDDERVRSKFDSSDRVFTNS